MTPNAERAPAQLLEWDTDFFGFRVARLADERLTTALVERALQWCDENAIHCLYFLAAADDPDTIRLAEQHGFHVVDGRLVLECKPGDRARTASPSVRPWRPSDLVHLRAIAGIAHHDSRFYFDLGFPRDRCDALYQSWIERSCQGYAEQVLVADFEDRAVGYVTCHLAKSGNGSIGLMGVADAAQGRGFGKALVDSALHWFASQGATRVTVPTQARNIAAQRLYQACGFRSASFHLWYHWWNAEDR